MGFGIYGIYLILPVIIVILGIWLVKSPPKKINYFAGYRTKMSMKNKDTWIFAQNYCGRLFIVVGAILLVLYLPAIIFLHSAIGVIGMLGRILLVAPVILVIIIAIFTEMALRANFDNAGNRKK